MTPAAAPHGVRAGPPPGRFLYANGLRIHYLSVGDGDRGVVVLHKVTGGGETWLDHATRLHGALGPEYRIVLPDLRGHGYSDQPEWGYSLVDHDRDLMGLVAALGLDRPVLVGHSLGARIALNSAAAHPDAVGGVVALDPPLSGPGRPRYRYDLASLLDWRRDVEERGVAACLESSSPYTPREAELRARYGLLCSLGAMTESWFGFHLEDVHGAVARLRVPCLLLLGEHGVVGKRAAAELTELNPHAAIRRVSGAGHNVATDAWPDVEHALVGFVRRVARPAGRRPGHTGGSAGGSPP